MSFGPGLVAETMLFHAVSPDGATARGRRAASAGSPVAAFTPS
jgi:hypothetical protein